MKKALLLAVVALTSGIAAAQMKNPDTLVSVSSGDWGTGFDPVYCYDTACGNVLDNTVESLFGYNGNDPKEIVPRLAAELPTVENGGISEDGLTYTIKLRPNLTFSDGSPVTAADVEYSFERMMVYSTDVGPAGLLLEPLVGSAALVRPDGDTSFAQIDKSVETQGDDTVVFTLAKPFAPFLSELAGYYSSVYSKADAVSKSDWSGEESDWQNFNNTPEGSTEYATTGTLATGPFTIERYDVGSTVVLQRNDNYWRDPAQLSRVILQSIPDDNTRVQLLSTGDADMATRDIFPQSLLPTIEKIPGVTITQNAGLSLYGFFMTHDIDGSATNYLGSGKLDGNGIPADFFSDIDVRKGFASAFDYKTFIADVMQGAAEQQNTVAIKGLIGYTEESPKYVTDPEQAADHFRKAFGGQVWENGFTLPTFFNSGNTTRQQGLQILKQNIEQINPKFKIEVRELQFSQILTQAAAHQLTLWMGGWGADFADPHSFAQPFLATNGNYPQNMRFSDPALDKMIDDAVLETDPDARAKLYQEIAQIGFDKVPEIAAYQPLQTFIQHDWVQGRVTNPMLSSDYFYGMSKVAN